MLPFLCKKEKYQNLLKQNYGYHIIYLEKIRGQEYDVRHILLIPEVSQKQT